jgi:PAS domain S-box-containing protein
LRELLSDSHAGGLIEAAELALSELVTNAVLHAGTEVKLRVHASDAALRVEVEDGSPHLPVRRRFATTAGTGRGLRLLDRTVDRWDVAAHEAGKTVWFEIGEPANTLAPSPGHWRERETAEVVLLQVPLLMHAAWQEHAASLLRELLLLSLGDDGAGVHGPAVPNGVGDDPDVWADPFELHARASDALSLLGEQLPVPDLRSDPTALMLDATEPRVTASRQVLHIPLASVDNFRLLDELLSRAIEAADAGQLLVPSTQPEVAEMRRWLCAEVVGQALGGAAPTPWRARTDVRAPHTEVEALEQRYRQLARPDEAVILADEASVIVAVTSPALHLLGYDDESQLLGRRVIAIVPERLRQAHVAGTTLHLTNGRDLFIGVPVRVPAVRADGTEIEVGLTVTAHHIGPHERVFMASFEHPER